MSIRVDKCNFFLNETHIINNVEFELQPGNRCLLVGGNGVGKTTLLKLLAGKHMCENVFILDKHTFHDTTLNFKRNYLDENWGLRTIPFAGQHVPYMSDIKVKDMMKHLQEKYVERRQQLIDLLDIDPEWRMHQVSSGQRRRVQLFLGLLRPVEVILLDEISNVLDIVCREKLFKWLYEESLLHHTTIVYATHIFDGLQDWFSHILYLQPHSEEQSSVGYFGKSESISLPLYQQVKTWLLNEKKTTHSQQTPKPSTLTTSTCSAGGFAPGRFYNYW